MKNQNFELEKLKRTVTISFPYLFASEGFWINADGDTLEMDNPSDMPVKHLENCMNILKIQNNNINNRTNELKNLNNTDHGWDLKKMRINKIAELRIALKNR